MVLQEKRSEGEELTSEQLQVSEQHVLRETPNRHFGLVLLFALAGAISALGLGIFHLLHISGAATL